MSDYISQRPLKILLANPRGFCAGVSRAILIVEKLIENHGPPVYVRHEIVHNRHVVDSLRDKGAVFIDELEQVPDGAPVVFSAHGVASAVIKEADMRGLGYIDAACPLVHKVHSEVVRHAAEGRHVIVIGHKKHQEVIGIQGQVDEASTTVVETVADAESIHVDSNMGVAYVTQTTLSVDETRDIINVLRQRFPALQEPHKNDICYATSNRQNAVKLLAEYCDAIIVIGGSNSSNTRRLLETAERAGCERVVQVCDYTEIDWQFLKGVKTLGITGGASTPELLIQDLIKACKLNFRVSVEDLIAENENVHFNLSHRVEVKLTELV